MALPQDLREQSRRLREASVAERDVRLKLSLASHALMLAQIAEKIEREEPQTQHGKHEQLAS